MHSCAHGRKVCFIAGIHTASLHTAFCSVARHRTILPCDPCCTILRCAAVCVLRGIAYGAIPSDCILRLPIVTRRAVSASVLCSTTVRTCPAWHICACSGAILCRAVSAAHYTGELLLAHAIVRRSRTCARFRGNHRHFSRQRNLFLRFSRIFLRLTVMCGRLHRDSAPFTAYFFQNADKLGAAFMRDYRIRHFQHQFSLIREGNIRRFEQTVFHRAAFL